MRLGLGLVHVGLIKAAPACGPDIAGVAVRSFGAGNARRTLWAQICWVETSRNATSGQGSLKQLKTNSKTSQTKLKNCNLDA